MAAQGAEPPDVLFAELPAALADGRARGSASPTAARARMVMAFEGLLALDSGLARWCSLSISAWRPSAAPDHGRSRRRAAGCSFC